MRIAIGTCKQLPEPDPDQSLLLEALAREGADPVLLAWDDSAPIPDDLDCCVLRSTWDYYRDPARFLSWVDAVANRMTLLNPRDIVRWNHHKHYMDELEKDGLRIVPTAFMNKGESTSLEQCMNDRGWDDVVVKPSVSAASFRTKRFMRNDVAEGEQFLAELCADRDCMVQRYMPEVDHSGERSLVWIDGELTHAIRKDPRFAGHDERVSEALTPTSEERSFADAALQRVASKCLYARVDVVRDDDGALALSELELIEPSLFLLQHPPALDRLVNAIMDRAPSKS